MAAAIKKRFGREHTGIVDGNMRAAETLMRRINGRSGGTNYPVALRHKPPIVCLGGNAPGRANQMNDTKPATTIKKYANRRLYNTGNSAYVTLEDLAEMVKKGEDFVVFDAKTSEDITRSVLTQIIFEQEAKDGQSLLPVTFLRQLIRFYGDSMQMVVPSYLEFTIGKLSGEHSPFRAQMAKALAGQPLAEPTLQMFSQMEEQARKNMAMFNQALSMFNPFVSQPAAANPPAAGESSGLDDLRREMQEMQMRLEKLSRKS